MLSYVVPLRLRPDRRWGVSRAVPAGGCAAGGPAGICSLRGTSQGEASWPDLGGETTQCMHKEKSRLDPFGSPG